MSAFLAGVLMVGVLVTPGESPARESATSVFGPQPTKMVTATCASGSRYAGGGMINYGVGRPGGVAITAVLPDAEGTSITVIAQAPAGRVGSWSVTAYALCHGSETPEPVVGTGSGIAEATCTGPDALFGLGFRVDGGVVKEVAMDAALRRVRVVADDWGAQVTAVALCRRLAADMRRVETTTEASSWPIVAGGTESDPDAAVYPVGARVEGPPSATLDALVPGPDDGLTWARGTLLDAGARRGFGEEGGSVTVQAGKVGTFH